MTGWNFRDSNAWDNGSWIRTEGDLQINNRFLEEQNRFLEEQNALRRQERQAEEAELRRIDLEFRAARRARTLEGPARALKQYQSAIRKIGIMAVSEALGVG